MRREFAVFQKTIHDSLLIIKICINAHVAICVYVANHIKRKRISTEDFTRVPIIMHYYAPHHHGLHIRATCFCNFPAVSPFPSRPIGDTWHELYSNMCLPIHAHVGNSCSPRLARWPMQLRPQNRPWRPSQWPDHTILVPVAFVSTNLLELY